MIPFTTAESRVLGVAAPNQAQSPLAAIYPPPPNTYGMPPRLTGYVNLVFVQAVGPDLIKVALRQVTFIRRFSLRHAPALPASFPCASTCAR